ncbi:MAG: nuclear transport factor 2 family protein [Gammaproteobacteria bacterium]
MQKSNEDIITEFIRTWSDLDAEKLVDYFAADGCYYNMPLEPVTGRDALLAFIEGFLSSWSATDWEIRTIISAGDIVIAERLDKTKTSAGDVDLPCVGVFEMCDGKIKEWRDYFDMATYTNAISG